MNKIAMAQAVQNACRKKFRGRENLVSKVAPHYPANLEREYMRITNAYMALLNQILQAHLPIIRQAITAERERVQREANMRHDTSESDYGVYEIIADTFVQIAAIFEERVLSFGLRNRLIALADQVRRRSIRDWRRIVRRTLGIDIMQDYFMGEFYRKALTLWGVTNVDLIKTIPKNALVAMQNIVLDGWRQGISNTTIGKQIQEAYGIHRRRAYFIARDQMAKLNADLSQAQQQDAGVKEYIWSTSGDERVRGNPKGKWANSSGNHYKLDGKRFSWNDPPEVDRRTGRKAHPGQDYQCRCVPRPVFNLPGLSLPWEKGVEL